MKITLDYPPSANVYWRRHGNVIHRSAEATAYKEAAGWICRTAGLQPVTGDVRVWLSFYRPAKRGDLDNLLKVTIDSLIGFAYEDDSQIVEIHATRHEDKHAPRVEIVVEAA